MVYAFRFYGRRPDEFAEGANEGHRFTVQWAHAPNDEALRALGRLFEITLASGPADPSGGWHWSERFSTFAIGERWPSGHGFLGALTDFFVAAGDVVPIVDVVYHNAQDAADRWSAWSLAQQSPDPGPAGLAGVLFAPYRRAVDPSLAAIGAGSISAAFVAGRQDGRAARLQQRVDDAIAVQLPGKIGLALSGLPKPPDAPLRTWPAEDEVGFAVPEPREIDRGTYKAAAPGDHPFGRLTPTAPPMAWVYGPGTRRINLAWLDEHGQRREAFTTPHYQISRFTLSPDGDAVLLVSEPTASLHQVSWLDLKRGVHRVVCSRGTTDDRSPLVAALFTANDTWLIASEKQLRLFDAATGEQLATLKAAVDRLRPPQVYREGSLVVLGGRQTSIVAIANREMKRLGTISAPVGHPTETEGGRLLVSVADRVYEITHLEPLFDAFASKKGKRARTAGGGEKGDENEGRTPATKRADRSVPTRKRKPELVELPDEDFLKPEDDSALRASLEIDDGLVWARPDGVQLGLKQHPRLAPGTYGEVRLRVAPSAPRLVLTQSYRGVDLAYDGTTVLLAAHEGLEVASIDGGELGEPSRAFSLPSKEFGFGVMGLSGGLVAFSSSKALYLLRLRNGDTAELLHVAKVPSARALLPIHELGAYVVLTAHPGKLYVGVARDDSTRWIFKETVNTKEVRVDGRDVVLGPALTKKGSRRLAHLASACE